MLTQGWEKNASKINTQKSKFILIAKKLRKHIFYFIKEGFISFFWMRHKILIRH
jgi:hypothetical protein